MTRFGYNSRIVMSEPGFNIIDVPLGAHLTSLHIHKGQFHLLLTKPSLTKPRPRSRRHKDARGFCRKLNSGQYGEEPSGNQSRMQRLGKGSTAIQIIGFTKQSEMSRLEQEAFSNMLVFKIWNMDKEIYTLTPGNQHFHTGHTNT